MTTVFRLVNGLMTLLFAYATAVNFNDPDWYLWVAFYGAATVVSGWAALRPASLPWLAPAAIAAVAVLWAVRLAPEALTKVRFSELWVEEGMKTPQIEIGREFYGLVIVAVWMVAIALVRALATRAR